MNQPDPSQPPPRIDLSFLLHAAERLPGDPQVDDWGKLFGAIERMYARALDHDVYGSVYLKAAALLETLARLPCLEHSNEAFAWHCAEAYLALMGHPLSYESKDAVALVHDSVAGRIGVGQIARQLKGWTAG